MGQRGSDTATQSFPLNDIDYESDPMAVAQELSNLQAIRRMSMDVNGMDPDLPAFNLSLGVPTVAPSHRSDEEDPSRLFWVPASVHPELAPNQFKTFIQERVRTLKRSSLSEQPLAPDNASGGGIGSLRRRKSMLSRQIDNGNGYEDGATRLEKQKSKSGQPSLPVNLHELEELMSDPNLVRRSIDSGSEVPISEDMPILPAKPAGQTLKRSTRTQYRRGSLRKGGVIARRQTLKNADEEQAEKTDSTGSKAPQLPDVPALPDLSELANSTFGLTRTQTEPLTQAQSKSIENFSRPGRRLQTPPTQQPPSTSWNQGGFDEAPAVQKPELSPVKSDSDEHRQAAYHSRYANGRPTQYSQPIPQIIESQPDEPPALEHLVRSNSLPVQAPERKSSMEPSPPPTAPLPRPGPHRQPASKPQSLPQRQAAPNSHRPANITLDDIAGSPSMVPGNSNRSDSLSVIPTYHDEGKKVDKKKNKEDGSRKPSWGWFSSSNSEEKEREKREKEEREASKKNKSKLQKPGDARHDARLDVLQSSIDGTPRRESNVFDRQSLSIPDESDNSRKPSRKTSGEVKKEKDSGIFSSLFGSSKRKSEKETGGSGGKKGSSLRGLSPDPPPRLLRADIDYNWSRFSILEERAIYRMAHIKLANPRRELYSQVLLSNFMYSYLAKVQQMHPQIQIPQSAAQKQQQRQEKQQQAKMLEDERRMRQQQAERQATMQPQQQPQVQGQVTVEEFAQYQRYQDVSITPSNHSIRRTNVSMQHQARLEEQQRYAEHDDMHHQQQQYNQRGMHPPQQGYGSPQHHQQQPHPRHQQQSAQQQPQQHPDYQYQRQYGMNGQPMHNGAHHPEYAGHGSGFNVQGGGMMPNQGQQQWFQVGEQAGGTREEGFW
jgi:hypothetical protein